MVCLDLLGPQLSAGSGEEAKTSGGALMAVKHDHCKNTRSWLNQETVCYFKTVFTAFYGKILLEYI